MKSEMKKAIHVFIKRALCLKHFVTVILLHLCILLNLAAKETSQNYLII